MANDDPPGVVLPFKRSPKPARLPPRDPVFEAVLQGVMGQVWRDLDGTAAVFDSVDLEAGLAWAEEAIAQGVEGGPEAKVDLRNLRAFRTLVRGDADAARAEWDALIEEHPANVAVHVMRARFHERRGEDAAAIADLDRAVELAPTDPAGYLRRAAFYEAKGDRPRALANFRRGAQLDPTSDEALLGLARGLDAEGDARGAKRVYARAAEKELADADEYEMRGFMHFVSGQTELALADYETSLALSPNRPEALSWRGLCRLKLGRYDGAIADFTRYIALKPGEALGFWRRGEALLRSNEPARALPDLERAIALGPDEQGAAHYLRGNAHEALGNREAALLSYDVAMERSPANVAWHLRRFQIHNEAEDWPKCQIDADALLALAPESTVVLLAHARLCVRNDRRDDARVDYDRLIALDPLNADAYHERAHLRVGRGDNEAAREDVARAFELKPEDREIRASYGRDLGLVARTPAERAAATQLIASSAELDPENAQAWADAGRCFLSIGYHDEAAAHFSRAIELDPDDADYLSERASCVRNQGPAPWQDPSGHRVYVAAALADVDRAIEITGEDDLELLRQRAGLREDLGDLEGALADTEHIIELEPDLIDGYAERARLRKLTGDMPGARADAERVAAMEDETMKEMAAFIDVSNMKRFNLDEA